MTNENTVRQAKDLDKKATRLRDSGESLSVQSQDLLKRMRDAQLCQMRSKAARNPWRSGYKAVWRIIKQIFGGGTGNTPIEHSPN